MATAFVRITITCKILNAIHVQEIVLLAPQKPYAQNV